MTAVDLTTAVADVTLANPVMTASGCAGTGREIEPYLDLSALGAFVTRTVTLDPRAGHPLPRVVETSGGVLSSTGLQSAGVDAFLATELPWLVQQGTRAVVSVAGRTLAEYAELARRVGGSPGVSMVEVNLSSPDLAGLARVFGTEPYHAAKVVSVVRREVPPGVPVLAKLTPDVTSIVDVARAAVDSGADGLVLVDAPRGLAVDPLTLRPTLGGGTGGLSGPAIHPLALRCVWEVRAALSDVAIVGVGGVRSGVDALTMAAAGADAVQVGTAVLHDPAAPARIVAELEEELRRRQVSSMAAVVGRAHRPEGDQP